MRTLRWEAEARRQYRDSLSYISDLNPLAADKLAGTVARQLDLVLQFPEMGRKGRILRTRELIVHPNYLIVYAVRARTIDVIRFLHARQIYP